MRLMLYQLNVPKHKSGCPKELSLDMEPIWHQFLKTPLASGLTAQFTQPYLDNILAATFLSILKKHKLTKVHSDVKKLTYPYLYKSQALVKDHLQDMLRTTGLSKRLKLTKPRIKVAKTFDSKIDAVVGLSFTLDIQLVCKNSKRMKRTSDGMERVDESIDSVLRSIAKTSFSKRKIPAELFGYKRNFKSATNSYVGLNQVSVMPSKAMAQIVSKSQDLTFYLARSTKDILTLRIEAKTPYTLFAGGTNSQTFILKLQQELMSNLI